MILPFSTQLNGKPTYFPEKIWQSFDSQFPHRLLEDQYVFSDNKEMWDILKTCNPKFHTIRKDEKNRWKEGVLIDFFINARKKDMFRFAPKVPVISIQHIDITNYNGQREIHIDGKKLGQFQIQKLVLNDGFESVKDFF